MRVQMCRQIDWLDQHIVPARLFGRERMTTFQTLRHSTRETQSYSSVCACCTTAGVRRRAVASVDRSIGLISTSFMPAWRHSVTKEGTALAVTAMIHGRVAVARGSRRIWRAASRPVMGREEKGGGRE